MLRYTVVVPLAPAPDETSFPCLDNQISPDLIVTLDDFRACGWKEALAGEDDDFRSIYPALWRAAETAVQVGRIAQGKVLWLVGDACSMMLSPSSANQPFRPVMESSHGRSAIPDDFTQTDIVFFSQIVDDIDNPWIKARLADLVWFRQRRLGPRYALMAIDAYRTIPLDVHTWVSGGRESWKRAIRLALALGAGAAERLATIETDLLGAFEATTAEDGFGAVWLSKLLLSHHLAEDHSADVAANWSNSRGISKTMATTFAPEASSKPPPIGSKSMATEPKPPK